jgi:hypothetical protein
LAAESTSVGNYIVNQRIEKEYGIFPFAFEHNDKMSGYNHSIFGKSIS